MTDVDLQSDNGYLTIWRYPSGGTPIDHFELLTRRTVLR